MCGIAGFSGNFSKSLLSSMNATLTHRGPDDSDILYLPKEQIGLSHNRLSIIDLSSAGKQPMWDATKSAVIVFNGEIYNYPELKEDLVRRGFSFKSSTDTEVILNLYLKYGVEMLNHLNGIFAFAIWDKREDTLFLARDGLGVKPLYVANVSNGFLFASEIKALLQESTIDTSLDPFALFNYLTFLWSPTPRTILRSVQKLEPGHALLIRRGQIIKKWQYYDLPYSNSCEEHLSVDEAVDSLIRLLSQAVSRQMIADVPVGAFLSGGLDSSAIVSFAQKHLTNNQKLQCFTIGFKDETFSKEGLSEDLPFAQRVAKHLGVDLNTIFVGPEMIEELPKMIYHLDEPQADPAPLNVLFISQLAKSHNIKVLLSGAGGDDLFSGYRRHYALLLERYWKWLPTPGRKLLAEITKIIPKGIPTLRRFAKAFQFANLDGDERIASYFYWNRPALLKNLFDKNFLYELNQYNVQNPLLECLDKLPSDMHPLNKMLYLESKFFLADHNLNYTDKMSMAVGVEVRVPFLDPDLVNFACNLPVYMKQNGKQGKWIVKKAMEALLPKSIIYRPKTGFGAPLRHWLHNELKPVMHDCLSNTSITSRGIFNPDRVADLIAADKAGMVDATYTIFSLICIEIWCRIFLDKKIIIT